MFTTARSARWASGERLAVERKGSAAQKASKRSLDLASLHRHRTVCSSPLTAIDNMAGDAERDASPELHRKQM